VVHLGPMRLSRFWSAFILLFIPVVAFAAGGGGGGGSGGGGGGVSTCDEDEWSCGEWSECTLEGEQTRECELDFDCTHVTDPNRTPPQVVRLSVQRTPGRVPAGRRVLPMAPRAATAPKQTTAHSLRQTHPLRVKRASQTARTMNGSVAIGASAREPASKVENAS
jgi:hypothetical protein